MTLLDPPISVRPPPQPKRWTGAEYDRLVESGAFDRQRLELLNGELIEMSPMGEDHAQTIVRLIYTFLPMFPPGLYTLKPQIPFRLNSNSRPEPDVALYRGSIAESSSFDLHPVLVIEVSDSSLNYDRNQKLPAYASQHIPEVWIVNLQDACVEVYRNPHEIAGGAFAYSPATVLRKGDSIATLERPDTPINASDLLP
jgi:Uma2 family endonuclease